MEYFVWSILTGSDLGWEAYDAGFRVDGVGCGDKM